MARESRRTRNNCQAETFAWLRGSDRHGAKGAAPPLAFVVPRSGERNCFATPSWRKCFPHRTPLRGYAEKPFRGIQTLAKTGSARPRSGHCGADRASPRIASRSDRVRNGPRKNRRAGVSILHERAPRPRARHAIPPFNLSTLSSPRSRSAKTVLICRRGSARLRARFAPLQTADPLKPGKFKRSKAACWQGACCACPFLRVS